MRKRMIWLMMCSGILASAAVAADKSGIASTTAGTAEAQGFNVLKYGAVGDDKTDNTNEHRTSNIERGNTLHER